jgi:uncharacterized SAM-binding protein YcdF (DUF218 family)
MHRIVHADLFGYRARRLVRLIPLALLALGVWFVVNAGTLLIDREPLQPSDALIVLAGNAPDRLPYALQLREQGLADLVVVSNERIRTHGLDVSWLDVYQAGHSASELPASALAVLDPPPENTMDEARRAADVLQSRGLRTALLVTDPFHSRRAALLFRAEFGRRGLAVRSAPVMPDSLGLAQWWASPLAARRTTEEWTKLAAYFVQGAFW